MVTPTRAARMDVSNTVDVTDSAAVAATVQRILAARYAGADFGIIATLGADVSRLYSGQYPGFRDCDVGYHNEQHVLDVTLAMARLIDGYEQSHTKQYSLGAERALAGIIAALFHDSGYIRRRRDTRHKSGGAYTRSHIERSARFIGEYLPGLDLEALVPMCSRLVQFTNSACDPGEVKVADPLERVLGELLGTADLIAQMADLNYASKCRDYLYDEFEAGGLAGTGAPPGINGIIYRSPQHLLETTPEFMRTAIRQRLDGYFQGAHRYAAMHFGGDNLYMTAIEQNYLRLQDMLQQGQPD